MVRCARSAPACDASAASDGDKRPEKDKDPAPSGILLGIEVTLRPGGNGSFRLPEDKRSRYLAKVQHVLDVDCLSPGQAAKLAGRLSFASSVTLGRFGRPFLQPVYALAAGRSVDEIHPLPPAESVAMGPADKGLSRGGRPTSGRSRLSSRTRQRRTEGKVVGWAAIWARVKPHGRRR